MDFETIKRNAVNAFRQLMVLRVIVTSPNEKVADVPALYALVALLLHRGSARLCWFWASCSNTAFDSRKTPSECDPLRGRAAKAVRSFWYTGEKM